MRERRRWLGQWWFLTAVVVLGVNDHVLKGAFPSWWTGKLSDFAGPVVVATLLGVLLGRGVGVAATAVGFVALKTVPGIAEAAAPILGGVTLRDATDLIGLVTLVPAWWMMRPAQTARAPSRRHRRSIQVAGLFAAVLVTTATSYDDPPSVREVRLADGVLYALVHDDWGSANYDERGRFLGDPWAASTDGGLTWERADAPTWTSRGGGGRQEVCRTDGWCFRATGPSIDARPPGDEWRTEFRLTWNQGQVLKFHRYEYVDLDSMFSTLVIAPTSSGEHVVASAAEEGVAVLDTEGRWHRVGVLSATPTDLSGWIIPLWIGRWSLIGFGAVTLFVLPIRAMYRGRYGGFIRFLVLIAALAIALYLWASGATLAFRTVVGVGVGHIDNPTTTGLVTTALAIATLIVPMTLMRFALGPIPKKAAAKAPAPPDP